MTSVRHATLIQVDLQKQNPAFVLDLGFLSPKVLQIQVYGFIMTGNHFSVSKTYIKLAIFLFRSLHCIGNCIFRLFWVENFVVKMSSFERLKEGFLNKNLENNFCLNCFKWKTMLGRIEIGYFHTFDKVCAYSAQDHGNVSSEFVLQLWMKWISQ